MQWPNTPFIRSQTANGKPPTANRQRQTANGKPKTENGKPPMVNRQRQTANGKPQIANGKPKLRRFAPQTVETYISDRSLEALTTYLHEGVLA